LTVSALPSLKRPIISCAFENTVHSMQLQVLITST
jgi:hypothetical protein